MKAMLTALLLAVVPAVAACGPRKVQVQTAPAPASAVSLQVTNDADQAVNVYVTQAGNDLYVGQVPARSTQTLDVRGVAVGSTVMLKARTTDGTRTYTNNNVVLNGVYTWHVP